MRLREVLFALMALFMMHPALADELECGPLKNAFGPFDYRTDKDKLGVVEDHHFTPPVEKLESGQSASIGGDIDYTLRAFPNHPRALVAMTKLGERLKKDRIYQAKWPVPCYYDRAVRFRPDDGTVRVLYANFLMKRGKTKEALEHIKAAEQVAGSNANLHYNIGLECLELKEYDKSLVHAHEAYRLGFPLPGLRNRLERLGKWVEPSKVAPQERVAAPRNEPSDKTNDTAARQP